MLLHIKQKEYKDNQDRVVETVDGKNFRTRSYSPRSMSSDHNKVYILESYRLREIDRQSLRIRDTALDNNQQIWKSFQPVHTKLPATLQITIFLHF